MSRHPLDYARVLVDRVTGRSADVLNDTVLDYRGKGGKSKGAASAPMPDYRTIIQSTPTAKFIDVFLSLHFVGKTKEFVNAIKFFYQGGSGDAADKKWLQFASRRFVFEDADKATWSPAKLKSVSTVTRSSVPVTQGTSILWNVDSASTTDPYYSFEVEYTSDNSGVAMVDSPTFPPKGVSSAQDLYTLHGEGRSVKAITMIRTMKTYLLRSDVAVWGCSWTSTITCRLDSRGWESDSNDYKINEKESGLVSALDKDHAAALLAEYKGSPIR